MEEYGKASTQNRFSILLQQISEKLSCFMKLYIANMHMHFWYILTAVHLPYWQVCITHASTSDVLSCTSRF